MNGLDSDELRRQLSENNAAMNTLAEDNQKIVELLAQRGLQAVDPAGDDISIHPCIMQLDKLQSEPKPLTADELKAGGWWCEDVSEECRLMFAEKGLETRYVDWSTAAGHKYCYLAGAVIARSSMQPCGSSIKQIHRIGNEFYWSAP